MTISCAEPRVTSDSAQAAPTLPTPTIPTFMAKLEAARLREDFRPHFDGNTLEMGAKGTPATVTSRTFFRDGEGPWQASSSVIPSKVAC